MIRENKRIIKRYPFLGVKDESGKYYDDFTWLDSLPDGWRTLALLMSEEIREDLLKYDYLDKYKIIEAKEKYGSMNIYDCGIPEESKVFDILSKYNILSQNVCCSCGKPDVPIAGGWISPWCDVCYHGDDWRELSKDQNPHRMGEWHVKRSPEDKEFNEDLLATAEKYREQYEMERKADETKFQGIR